MFFDIWRRYFGGKTLFDSRAEKTGKLSVWRKETGKLYISETEIINVRILNGVEKGYRATLGKVAQSPIHWG